MTKTLLWLDDYRDPFNKKVDWLAYSPIGRNVDVVWVTTFQEFVDHIMIYGLPDGICFDHDLHDQHYRPSMYAKDGRYNKYYTDGTFTEKTGYDCAKWLVEYCMDNDKDVPPYGIQSANPVGRENIDKLLKSYTNFRRLNNNKSE